MDNLRHAARFLLALALALTLPRVARAANGPRFELESNLSPTLSWTVRKITSSTADTTIQLLWSGSGAVLIGPVLAGVSVSAASGTLGGRLETFAGGFIGSELLLDRTLLRAVAEGGMHWIEQPGNDGTYHSTDLPSVELPFVGLRLSLERQLRRHKRTSSLGASAYIRADLGHEQVSGTITQTCSFGDFDCEYPSIPAAFDVGGLMVGLGVSVTWGTDR